MTAGSSGWCWSRPSANVLGWGKTTLHGPFGRFTSRIIRARLTPQCDGLILNANGDPARFAAFRLPVVADDVADYPGPLAGILAALDWMAAKRPEVKHVLSAAADCPFLPRDLMARLAAAREEQGAELAVAASGGQTHPVIGLWSVRLRENINLGALTIGSIEGIDSQVRIIAGEWDADKEVGDGDEIPVMVSNNLLYTMGVQVGDTLTAQRSGADPVTLRVVAMWEPLNENDPLLSSIEDPRRRGTLIAQLDGVDSWRIDIRLQRGARGDIETVFLDI